MVHRRTRASRCKDRLDSIVGRVALEADQLIQGRQCCRQLHALTEDAVHLRQEWCGSASVARVAQLISRLEGQHARVDLPAGGGMRFRRMAEHRTERRYSLLELRVGPRLIGSGNAILPT